MNNKIIELLSRATPANDTSAPTSTTQPKIKFSLFNRNNIAKDGSSITIISLDSVLVIAIILILIVLGVFFQQKI